MSESTGECNVCKAPAKLRCSTCHSTYYCGKAHQRSDWIQHKAVCKSYEIGFSPLLGFHLIAAKDLQEGDVILIQNPSLIGPWELSSTYHCVGCYRSLKQVEARCSGCKLPACKRSCPGLKDSAGHELECAIFRKPGPPGPGSLIWPDLGVFLRCMTLLKTSPEMRQWMLERMPYAARKRVSRQNSTRYLMMNVMQPILQQIATVGEERLDASPVMLEGIIDVLDAFSFDIYLNENDKISALYPIASLLQQSCAPNSQLSFVTDTAMGLKIGRVNVKAARVISKGEVLTFTSLPTTMTTLARQGYLLESRSMRCSCTRCLDPRELGSDFGTIKCTTCSGWILPINTVDIVGSQWKCSGKCKQTLSNDEAASRQVKLLDCMSMVTSKKVTLQKLEELLKKFEKNFHPNNWACLHLKRTMMKAYSIAPALLGNKKHFALTMESYGIALNPVEKISAARLERKAGLCRDILDVWDQISAGVFIDDVIPTADVLLNLASAEAGLMKQKFGSKKFDRDQTLAALERCQALLLRAENLLATKCSDKISEILAKDINTVKESLAVWADKNGLQNNGELPEKIAKLA